MDKRYSDRTILIDLLTSPDFEMGGDLKQLQMAFFMRTSRFLHRKYLVSLLKDCEQMGVIKLNWDWELEDSVLEKGELD